MTKTNRLFSAIIAGVGLTLSLVWVLSRQALPVAHAGSIGVDIFDDIVALDGDCSLREAIKAAELDINIDGCNGVGPDVIQLNTGTYVLTRTGTGEDAGLTGDLDITNTLVIAGNGPEHTTIDATGLISDRVLHIHSTTRTVVISGVRIIGGNIEENYGGGIRVDDANLILINTIIEDNIVVGMYNYGGGLYVQGGSVQVNESQIINNEAGFGGGLSVVSGQATLNGSQIVSNTASYGGGMDINSSTFTQTGNSLIAYNTSFGYGGGIAVWTSKVTLDGIQILDNESLAYISHFKN
jgi:CSLREA domain-containing protein